MLLENVVFNSDLYVRCAHSLKTLTCFFKEFSSQFYFLMYNKTLDDWSLGKQFCFPSNLDVSLDFLSGNGEILGKKTKLFPSGPVIKCIMSVNIGH